MLNSDLINGVYFNTGEIDMIIPIADARLGSDARTLLVIIPIAIIIFLILRSLYNRGKNASPATNREFKNRELIRKWKWKKKKWAKLQKGDSQAKISTVIGKPDSIQKEEEESGQKTWIYDFGSEGKRIITFKDGFIEKIEVKY